MPLAKYEFQTFNSNDSRTFHIGLVSIHKRSPEMSDLIGLGIDDRISWSEILIKKRVIVSIICKGLGLAILFFVVSRVICFYFVNFACIY